MHGSRARLDATSSYWKSLGMICGVQNNVQFVFFSGIYEGFVQLGCVANTSLGCVAQVWLIITRYGGTSRRHAISCN